MDYVVFNKEVARKLGPALKKTCGAISVAQNYKGTGKQAHCRQLWVRFPDGATDVWLEAGFIRFAGVCAGYRIAPYRYEADATPELVCVAVCEAIKTARAARAA